MANYTNEAQQRIIKLVEFLAGNEITGVPLKSVADHFGASNTAAFRDLKNLEEVGWARQMESSNWVLTPKATEPLKKISDKLRSALGEINRINKDYLQDTGVN